MLNQEIRQSRRVTDHRKPRRLAACAVLAALPALVALPPAKAGGDGFRIVPLHSRVDSRTYGEWSAAWWQWATAYDLDHNPILDPDGSFGAQGQSGPVWFLAGTFGGSAERSVTIPAGTYIFFPLANGAWDTVPGFPNPLNLPDPLSVADVRAILDYLIKDTAVSCEIDGASVKKPEKYRVKSPVFSLNFNADFASGVGYPAPYVRTAASDGYWLMLYPLSAGEHTIHFAADNPVTGFALDVTYNITVTE